STPRNAASSTRTPSGDHKLRQGEVVQVAPEEEVLGQGQVVRKEWTWPWSATASRCRNGPAPGLIGGAAVPQSGGVYGVRTGRPRTSSRDSHGPLCRDRRLAGTEQRMRGRTNRPDHPRGEGGERAGGAGPVLPGA